MWLLTVLAGVAGLGLIAFDPAAFGQRAIPWLALTVPGVLAARLAARDPDRHRPVRLSLAFLLAGVLLLPPAGGLCVGLAALIVGRGGGVAGPFGRGLAHLLPVALGLALADHVHLSLPRAAADSPGPLLMRLAVLFALVQVVSIGLGRLLAPRRRTRPRRAAPDAMRVLLTESVNVPVAFVLASLLRGESWLAYWGLVGAVLLAGYLLRRLDQAIGELRDTNDALAARVTELATLHVIGREIVSSLDPSRVFAIIERECRRIFDVDYFFIALNDRDTRQLQAVYRRRNGQRPEKEPLPLGQGLASWVVAEKRPLRVHDFRAQPPREPKPVHLVGPGVRSALAVPLVVEDRVIGVLSVQSRRPHAFDDHHLAVLTTIAQQAAVAIENARHYEMATVDSLTGLFLRDYFFRRLEEEYRRVKRYGGNFAVLMIDLDGFKSINDRHGHLAGDRYLQAVGAALRSRLRGADLGCRYGGDEFCLLLPETDLLGARVMADRLRVAVSGMTVKFEGRTLHATASVGVATFRDHDPGELRGLLRKADQALYLAKRAGRDLVVCHREPERPGDADRAGPAAAPRVGMDASPAAPEAEPVGKRAAPKLRASPHPARRPRTAPRVRFVR